MKFPVRLFGLVTLGLAWLVVAGDPSPTAACPFCNAVSMTLSEEMNTSDAVVIARLLDAPAGSDAETPLEDPAAAAEPKPVHFEIVEILKGVELLEGQTQIEVLYFGQQPQGTLFMMFGIDPADLAWSTPTPISERAQDYLRQTRQLPEGGADRLAFFQQFLEHAETMLANDAFDEFARAPYADVVALRERMDRAQLLSWAQNPDIPATRRRLYLTMLGVCGLPEDVPLLEQMICSDNREIRGALDALIACYLNLTGESGLPLIEDRFLRKADAEYIDTYAAIMALRFHGQEGHLLSRPRLLQSLRLMLDRPALADLVIPDLARWKDWSAADKLMELFVNADESNSWVRVPVVNYFRACEADMQRRIAELAQIDPEAVKRASFFMVGAGTPPAGSQRPADGSQPSAAPAGDEPAQEPAAEGDLLPPPEEEAAPAEEGSAAAPAANPDDEQLAAAVPAVAGARRAEEPAGNADPQRGVLWSAVGVGATLLLAQLWLLRRV